LIIIVVSLKIVLYIYIDIMPSKDDIIRPKKLKLYNALKIGYLRDEKRQKQRLKRFGYVLNPELTTREHSVAYNPTERKLLYISNGTDFSHKDDVANDLIGLFGASRLSKRREEEKDTLNKAKALYNPKHTTLVSHSLGSQFTNSIATATDKVIQYDPFLSANTTVRKNIHNYRTEGDIVSVFAPKENTTTLKAHGSINPIKSHDLGNIRNEFIFV